jgi:hypothetical protein
MSKRTRGPSEGDIENSVRGLVDPSTLHEVTRYVWWASHEGSTSALDRAFESKRMALLYACKQNSDSLERYAATVGKSFSDLFTKDGPYSLQPNSSFELNAFLELSDNEIEEYAERVCNAFSRHKVKEGVSYRYAPRASVACGVDELLGLLRRDPGASSMAQDHIKRQALLLSDIAGFD